MKVKVVKLIDYVRGEEKVDDDGRRRREKLISAQISSPRRKPEN